MNRMLSGGNGLVPGVTYNVKLGSTWDQIPTDLIHAVQYDFKPASIDPSQPGQMQVEGGNGVTVLLPHKDTDESSEFKGNKQQTPKDCFLIVDKTTNTIYLEKVSNMIRVKKHRSVRKKPAVRNQVPLEEGERASPVPAAMQAKDRVSPVPSGLQPKDQVSPVPTNFTPKETLSPVNIMTTTSQPRDYAQPTAQPRDYELHVLRPPSPKLLPNNPIKPEYNTKPELSDCEQKVKRLKPSTLLAASGNLSSESDSASDSDSSNDSSDSGGFVPVKPEPQLDLGGSGMLITPLGEPDVKEEGGSSGDAIMNMLSQDLDISSDSDSD